MGSNSESLGIIMMSPMKTCLYCLPWKTKKQCPYANSIKNLLGKNPQIKASIEAWLDKAFDEHSKQKSIGKNTSRKNTTAAGRDHQVCTGSKISPIQGTVYCVCAHIVDEWQHKYPLNDIIQKQLVSVFLARLIAHAPK